ncbi:hypothetical protein FGO68_gene6599 [Halteria grandinella]|uniref:Homeobox domain-containing protein n=1 Tax=Halteria grandinella TaxID=5974 RepID=A0A8J8T6W9_HALGN|nr:hypothetical protein FGO68_gene6599 [Halteria grandinella]
MQSGSQYDEVTLGMIDNHSNVLLNEGPQLLHSLEEVTPSQRGLGEMYNCEDRNTGRVQDECSGDQLALMSHFGGPSNTNAITQQLNDAKEALDSDQIMHLEQLPSQQQAFKRNVSVFVEKGKGGVQSSLRKVSHESEDEIESESSRRNPGQDIGGGGTSLNGGAGNAKHSKQATSVLKRWLVDHLQNPYLKPHEKTQLAQASGLTKKQVQNWFTNIRKRLIVPMMQKYQNKKDIKQILQRVKLRIDCSSGSSEQDDHQEKGQDANGAKKNGKQSTQKGDPNQKRKTSIGIIDYKNVGNHLGQMGASHQKFHVTGSDPQATQSFKLEGHTTNYEEEKQQQSNQNQLKLKKPCLPQQSAHHHLPPPPSNGDTKVSQYLEQQDLFNKRMLEQGIVNGDSGSSGRLHNQSESQSNGSSGIQQENNSGIGSSAGATSGQSLVDHSVFNGFQFKNQQSEVVNGANGSLSELQNNQQIQYIPIVMFCCPSLIRGEICHCGPMHSMNPIRLPSINHLAEIINHVTHITSMNQQQSTPQNPSSVTASSGNPPSSTVNSTSQAHVLPRLTQNNIAKFDASNNKHSNETGGTQMQQQNQQIYNFGGSYQDSSSKANQSSSIFPPPHDIQGLSNRNKNGVLPKLSSLNSNNGQPLLNGSLANLQAPIKPLPSSIFNQQQQFPSLLHNNGHLHSHHHQQFQGFHNPSSSSSGNTNLDVSMLGDAMINQDKLRHHQAALSGNASLLWGSFPLVQLPKPSSQLGSSGTSNNGSSKQQQMSGGMGGQGAEN